MSAPSYMQVSRPRGGPALGSRVQFRPALGEEWRQGTVTGYLALQFQVADDAGQDWIVHVGDGDWKKLH